MGKIAAVVSLKGGTGKSTIAVNLACQLAADASVTLVDADEQGTASYWIAQGRYPVELMPYFGSGGISEWIDGIAALKSDIVLIDAPPQLGEVTQAVIGLADLVLIPALASTADVMATGKTVSMIRTLRARRMDNGPRMLLVPSRVDRRTAAGKEIEAVLLEFGEPVAPLVRQRSALVDCFTAVKWIGTYARNSDAHTDIQTLAAVLRRMLRYDKAA